VTQVGNPNILAANQPSYCAAATANECFILVINNSCRGQRVEFHSRDQEFCPSNTAHEIEIIWEEPFFCLQDSSYFVGLLAVRSGIRSDFLLPSLPNLRMTMNKCLSPATAKVLLVDSQFTLIQRDGDDRPLRQMPPWLCSNCPPTIAPQKYDCCPRN
jgi:hypothetical protein